MITLAKFKLDNEANLLWLILFNTAKRPFSEGAGSGVFILCRRWRKRWGRIWGGCPCVCASCLSRCCATATDGGWTEDNVRALAAWKPTGERKTEIPFVIARVLLQDFTGVPLLADLAAMRDEAAKQGKSAESVEPLAPVELVVDHSIQVDHYGRPEAMRLNMQMEFERNRERYAFLKWGASAFALFG